jgi:hypothetical protein
MAGWVLFLTNSMESAIEVLLSAETAGLELHDLFLHDLGEDQIRRAPEKTARLLHHLLKSTNGQFYQALTIEDAYARFKAAGVDAEILRLIAEEATRFGIDL